MSHGEDSKRERVSHGEDSKRERVSHGEDSRGTRILTDVSKGEGYIYERRSSRIIARLKALKKGKA